MKKLLLLSILCVLTMPQSSLAAPLGTSERTELLAHIATLTKEVERLKALLSLRISVEANTRVFYPSTSEVRYDVVDGTIERGRVSPNPTHAELFQQFKDTVGKVAADAYISEFRVGHVRDTSLENYIEGFIELKPSSGTWVLTLRRDGTKPLNSEERELFTELFIHEYGHVVAYYEEAFSDAFTNRFWTPATYRASDRVHKVYDKEGYGTLEDSHRGFAGEFVSGYAMLNPDEDIAETFVLFIENPYPKGTSVLDEKVRYFYTNLAMVAARTEIRSNLDL